MQVMERSYGAVGKKEGAHGEVRPFEGLSVAVDGRPEARGEAASSLSGEPRSEVRRSF